MAIQTQETAETGTQTQADTGGRDHARRMTLIATSLGFAVVQLDVSVVNVAVRSIGAALGGGVSALQWVVSAYTVTFAAFILTAGAVGDRIGARRVFIFGFGVFMVASVICGLAPTLAVLVVARAGQGVGAAILVPASLSLLNHSSSSRPRGPVPSACIWPGPACRSPAGRSSAGC